MTDGVLKVLTWGAFAVHAAAAIVMRRRMVEFPLVALVNFATALCVLAYWAQRWYGYLAHGTTWYASDQLLPSYALIVCVLAAMTMANRISGTAQWVILAIDGVVLLGLALLFSVLRFDRMI
ncbi:MAG TPA: hypothetical protein VGP25_00960 [Gemmatimonadaceae bacterium]|jgi:hypothetical protein|nr:hypothetical protein [Gemmatimonadaceae bacterium]